MLRSQSLLAQLGLSLIDCTVGILLCGMVGGGKSNLIRLLATDILMHGNVALLWLCLKPSEPDTAADVINRAGCYDGMRRATPGNPGTLFNPAAYELMRQGGTPQTMADFLIRVDRIRQRSKGDQKGDEQFWENLFRMVLEWAITICWYAYRDDITLEQVYRVITTSPTSVEAANSPNLRSTYCGDAINRAIDYAKKTGDPTVMRTVDRAWDFFTKEFCSIGDKARGAAITFTSGVLGPFLISPLYQTCCQPVSTITPTDVLSGQKLILDAPVLIHGDAGRGFQLMFTMMTIDAALRRPIYADTPYLLVVRDEYPWFAEEADVLVQAVARQQRIIFLTAYQNNPVLQGALGGTLKAEQDMLALTGCHGIKFLMAQNCHKTCQYFSELCGHGKKFFMHVGQCMNPPERSGFVDQLLGVGNQQASFSEQWHPKLPPHVWAQLRTGSDMHEGIIDAYMHIGGRVFADGNSFRKVSFVRDTYEPARRKRFWR